MRQVIRRPPGRRRAICRCVTWQREPNRCLECRKPIKGYDSIRDFYCSIACERAGLVVKCMRCTPERKCVFCNMKAAPLGERRLDNMIRENTQQLKRQRQMLGHETREADSSHEAAWKKRRHS